MMEAEAMNDEEMEIMRMLYSECLDNTAILHKTVINRAKFYRIKAKVRKIMEDAIYLVSIRWDIPEDSDTMALMKARYIEIMTWTKAFQKVNLSQNLKQERVPWIQEEISQAIRDIAQASSWKGPDIVRYRRKKGKRSLKH